MGISSQSVAIVEVCLTRCADISLSFVKKLAKALSRAGVDQINVRDEPEFERISLLREEGLESQKLQVFLAPKALGSTPRNTNLIDGVALSVSSLSDLQQLRSWSRVTSENGLRLELLVNINARPQLLIDRAAEALSTNQEASLCLVEDSGRILPHIFYQEIKSLDLPEEWSLGVQASDWFGLGVANSLAAVLCGAEFVHVSSNHSPAATPLVAFVLAATLLERIRLKVDQRRLLPLAHLWLPFCEKTYNCNEAVIGPHSLSHVAGIHVKALIRDLSSYEPFDPQSIGCNTPIQDRILLGKLSGRTALAFVLKKKFGCQDNTIVERAIRQIKLKGKVCLSELPEMVHGPKTNELEDLANRCEKESEDLSCVFT